MKRFTLLLLCFIVFAAPSSFAQVNLGNLVWNDANGNGIKEVFENGIGGITVKLYSDNNADNIPDGPGFGTVIASQNTGVDGSYLFTSLAEGRYITSINIPTGYSVSPSFSLTPDDNINNDNNAAIIFNNQSEVRSNAITLTFGGEPTNDGDGIHGNLTFDLAICGNTIIGDYVWCDMNANGIQEDNETGFTNVKVTLTFPDGTTYTKYTDANGKYEFVNLGPATHTLTFETPAGFTPSPALQGTNRNIDSDPVNGIVSVMVLANTNNLSIDAGFFLKGCTRGNCNAGFIEVGGICISDRDADCISDVIDLDDDNDGIIDEVENNGYDALQDCDGDGTINFRDPTPGCPVRTGVTIYGTPYVPLTWTDCNNDGINDFFDWDRDGVINELDLDSDNDGILDIQESRDVRSVDNNRDGMADGIDEDSDGIMSSADVNDKVSGGPGLTPGDVDRDGLPNYLDLDSDGDGVVDITEALLFVDSDGLANGADPDRDGVFSVTYTNNDNSADNFNGFGAKGVRLNDTDADGFPNSYDIDDDNDGITDNVEAQPTCSEVQPFGVDGDADGLDDAYDTNLNACRRNAHGITPYDKDGDGTPDMYDEDTDNDGAPDFNEGSGITGNFITNYNDADGDGLIDQFDIFNIKTATSMFINNVAHSNMGPNGSFDGPVPAGSNAKLPQSEPGDCSTGTDRDWRDTRVLPVNLLVFEGNVVNRLINLSWATASEVNMKEYVIERSLNGQLFLPVGALSAKGNSIRNTYQFADDIRTVNAAVIFYRLKQVNANGTGKFSKALAFRLSRVNSISLTIAPNPARNYFNLQLNAAKDGVASIRLLDMFGKVVQTRSTRVVAGMNAISFDNLGSLAAGTYNVQLLLNGEIINRKLVLGQ